MPAINYKFRHNKYSRLVLLIQEVKSFFSISLNNPELVQSQFAAFAKQIPLLYFIMIVNIISACATHFRTAPLWMSTWAPGALCAIGSVRMISWVGRRHQKVTDAEAARRLRATVFLGPIMGFLFMAWGLCLFPYGDAYAQCHVAFFIAMTVIGCVFCLTPVRGAAFLSIFIVIVPFSVFFVQTGNVVLIAMAVNTSLAAVGMIVILINHYKDFAKLTEYQRFLLLKHEETQRLSNENVRIANHDSLTDLPNRRSFFAKLESLLDRGDTGREMFTVGLIDLDGFKAVNDVYGHAIGDRVLIETTHRLQSHVTDTISFARLGGDEFGVLIDCNLLEGDLTKLAKQICQSLGEPYILPETTVELSGSMGFAIFPQAGTSAQLLFERADYALYYAKQHLRGTAVVFSAEHETKIREMSLLEQELRQADLDREMSLVYQPIYDVGTGQTVAFEALARWMSPTRGMVPPSTFIIVAERSGMINQITEKLLKQALVTVKTWPANVGISFNLSVRDLASSEAIQAVMQLVTQSRVKPERISFEVTETMVMRDFDQGCEALHALRSLGVGISLDDFGTGYSSLSYVHRLPIDKLKIDRSFVADIVSSQDSQNIVKTLLSLCQNLGLECIVEGIETEAQSHILQELGCVMMQGYLFARPMEASAVSEHLASQAKIACNASMLHSSAHRTVESRHVIAYTGPV